MRIIPVSIIFFAVSATTNAHTLATNENIPMQLGHQIVGLHHLPLTALLVIGGIYLVRQLKISVTIDE